MSKILSTFLAVILGLSLGLAVAAAAGESPLHVARVLFNGAFGNSYAFGMTLFYTTPLIFTGLAVALPFKVGLFNIGAEGQLIFGALAAAAVGVLLPGLPWGVAPVTAGVAAFVAGGAWAWLAGWLKAKRQSHEVINTMMLNFVAAGISSYITLYWLKNPENQNPETAVIGAAYHLQPFAGFEGAPVGPALFLALFAVFLYWVFLFKTSRGFELRAVGQNQNAAQTAGLSPERAWVLSLFLSGGLAGLVGVAEVLGNAGRFKMGFSPDYGFIGIAVALLGRGHPLGIVASAFLFGALHKGAGDLDLETEKITRELALVLEGLVILAVCSEGLWSRLMAAGKKSGSIK